MHLAFRTLVSLALVVLAVGPAHALTAPPAPATSPQAATPPTPATSPQTAAFEATDAQAFDVLITGGHVLDGTGNPWFRADVGIRDGRIEAVGMLSDAEAVRRIDGGGRVVAPGFIDLHSHADDGSRRRASIRDDDERHRAAPNLVAQGATTVVVNQDGRSPWPIDEQRREIESGGVGPNVALMMGHGRLRREVMGDDARRPSTPAEVRRMRALVRQGMEAGAFGISAGLEYNPGRFSETDEVVALVAEIVPYGGFYISHERSEGATPMWYWPSRDEPGPPTLLDAVRETIEIGERSGAVVVASHIKAKGADYWGSGHAAVQLIQRARDRGVRVYADQYPYDTSGSDGSTVLIPRWALDGRRGGDRDRERDHAAALREVLADDERAADLRRDIAHEIARRGSARKIMIFDYPDSSYIGRTLGELAAMRGLEPVEMAIRLQLEGYPDRPGGGRIRGFSMSEYDIAIYARQPWTATASDAGIALPDHGPVHARYYGTFPRKIRKYALDEGVISVEHAIRSMTSLPAQIMGLRDRGQIREGFRADVVVLDLERLDDTATFFEPHRYPEGVDHVLVNGEFVVDDGELTWALPGRVISPAEGGRRPVAADTDAQ